MVKEKLIDIGVEVSASKIQNELQEKQVRDRITEFVEREYSKNIYISQDEEIDAEGLFDYLKNNFIDDVKNRLTEFDSKKRGVLHSELLDKAVLYAQANTKLSQQRAKKIANDGLELLRTYYKSKNNFELTFLVSQAVEAISCEFTEKFEEHQNQMFNNPMSATYIASCIRAGKINEAAIIMSQNASIINNEHCLKPYYGFSSYVKNGKAQIRSIPLLPDSEKKFPPRIEIVPSEIEIENRPVEQIDTGILRYSYNHQIPIIINVKEAIKYLGNKKDPIQYEAQELVGSCLEIKPKEFPPAFPCSIAIDDRVYFDYLLLRTKEILEDGTIVVDNREEENRRFIVEFRLNVVKQSVNIDIKVASGKNRDELIYNEFAYKASLGGEFAINILDKNEKLAYAFIKNSVESDKYLNNIDILEKVVAIENYFKKDISIPDTFPMEAYYALNWLYELVTTGKSTHKWSGYTFTFDLGLLKKETILKTEDIPYAMSLTMNTQIELFDLNETIEIKESINNLRIKDLDKLKQKAEVLDDEDPIKVKIIPNPGEEALCDCIDELVTDLSA